MFLKIEFQERSDIFLDLTRKKQPKDEELEEL